VSQTATSQNFSLEGLNPLSSGVVNRCDYTTKLYNCQLNMIQQFRLILIYMILNILIKDQLNISFFCF